MPTIIEKVQNSYQQRFTGSFLTVSAPGRINFIGEHTDYNLGFVLPAAIDKGIVVVMGKSEDGNSQIYSLDKDELISLDIHKPLHKSDYGWGNYVLGVVDQLQKCGLELKNFNCVFGGDIPIGSGLSSSAALENGIGFSLNELFELGQDRLQLLHLSQKAEHEFVGVKCGIMDQFSSMMGSKDQAMKLDCRSLEYQLYPAEFGDFQLVLFNSNVSHNLASSEYNVRRAQCEEGVTMVNRQHPEVQSLRDVDMSMLKAYKNHMSEVVFRRCKYIIEENERVNAFVKALEAGDFKTCGQILFIAHEAMRTEYEITCPEIDILIELAKTYQGVLGARMMGGGFGGCTLNLVHHDQKEQFIKEVSEKYFEKTKIKLSNYSISLADGVHMVIP